MGLFAAGPIDEVTVSDIADAVGMTPAAVYYHFASKDQILLEGMRSFGEDLVTRLGATALDVDDSSGLGRVVSDALVWAGTRRAEATVWFVTSNGINLPAEAQRRETRIEMVELLEGALRRARPDIDDAEAGVVGVTLVSLLETAMASMLTRDAAARSIGVRRFAAEIATLADRIAGIPTG